MATRRPTIRPRRSAAAVVYTAVAVVAGVVALDAVRQLPALLAGAGLHIQRRTAAR